MKNFIFGEDERIKIFAKFFHVPEKSQVKIKQLIKRVAFFECLMHCENIQNNGLIKIIVSDCLYLFESILNKRHRIGYISTRAIIENVMRVLEQKEFNEYISMKDLVDNNRTIPLLNKFYGQYKNASNFIHGTTTKGNSIESNFYNLIKSESSNSEINNLISHSLEVLDISINMMIFSDAEGIYGCFLRRESYLKFLISNMQFHFYKEIKAQLLS